MAVESAADLAALFSTADFAEAATYLPATGAAASSVPVIVSRPDQIIGLGQMGVRSPAISARMRVSDAPSLRAGDVLQLAGVAYRVAAPLADVTRSIWTFDLQEE